MTITPLRAGIVGLGVGKAHVHGYRLCPDVELAAVCDMNRERLEATADELNVAWRFTDYRNMLAEANLDIVSICLPNSLHAEASIAALEAGVHVICEKPMAITSAEAHRMIAAAEQHNRRLMVAYNFRYRPDTRWLYNIAQTGQLGTIYRVDATWRREIGIPGSGWFGNLAMAGGGALIDLGVHMLDLSLWMLGFPEATTVSGEMQTLFGPGARKTRGRKPGDILPTSFDVEDSAAGFIRLATGTTIHLHASWAEHTQPQDDRIRLELQGTEGTAVLTIPNYRNDDTLRMYTEIAGEPVTVIPTVRLNGPAGHEALVADLVESIRRELPAPTDGWQGLASVRILEALYESARLGREVALV